MQHKRTFSKWLFLITIALVQLATIVGSFHTAYAHGSDYFPRSRIYGCYLEGPESPSSDACKAAKEEGGSQPFYDWAAVSKLSHGAIGEDSGIPNGQICSAGNNHYRGVDLPRDDWHTTVLPSGGLVNFIYTASAPHKGWINYYITNSTYNPTEPLNWSNLDLTPFHTYDAPALAGPDGNYHVPNVQLPSLKAGRYLILSVWKRDDPAGETFYGCSDVNFDDSVTS